MRYEGGVEGGRREKGEKGGQKGNERKEGDVQFRSAWKEG
jgi:hypothetical protein